MAAGGDDPHHEEDAEAGATVGLRDLLGFGGLWFKVWGLGFRPQGF